MTGFVEEIIKKHEKKEEKVKAIKNSPMIQYLEKKTASIHSSSKARGSFGNLYAIYVLAKDFKEKEKKEYKGMKYKDFLEKQRTLPFGEKLQNHAVNSRCNKEFEKYFPSLKEMPIQHKKEGKASTYKINENLLKTEDNDITDVVLSLIERYIEIKLENFEKFISECVKHQNNYLTNKKEAINFVRSLLDKNVDARIFEIVSFALTKYYYIDESYFIGQTYETLKEVPVTVHKTGRTNANDGGIDFIMQPLGRIYQVTESLDFKKYFLDVDKLNGFKISFVVKTELSPGKAFDKIKEDAKKTYDDKVILKRYLDSFEEVITIPTLQSYLEKIIEKGNFANMLNEIILQSQVEYNLLKK